MSKSYKQSPFKNSSSFGGSNTSSLALNIVTNLYEIKGLTGKVHFYKMNFFDARDQSFQGVTMDVLRVIAIKKSQMFEKRLGCTLHEVLNSSLISFLNSTTPIDEFFIELDPQEAEVFGFKVIFFSRKDEIPKSKELFNAFFYSRIMKKAILNSKYYNISNKFFNLNKHNTLPGFSSVLYSTFDMTLLPISEERMAIQILNRHLVFPIKTLDFYINLASRDSSQWGKKTFHEYIDELYKERLIILSHRNGVHKISSFEWPQSKNIDLVDTKLDLNDENSPTYRDYYKRKYDQDFDDENTLGFPLVVHIDKKGRIFKFPAVLCRLKGYDPRDLHNELRLRSQISRVTIKPIAERFEQHDLFLKDIMSTMDKMDSKEKMSIEYTPFELKGRQLTQIQNLLEFKFSENGPPTKLDNYSSLNIRGFLKPTNCLQNWALIIEKNCKASVDEIINSFESFCKNNRIPYNPPKIFKTFDIDGSFEEVSRGSFSAVVFINRDGRFNEVNYQKYKKKLSFMSRGIPSQVIKESTLTMNNMDKKQRIFKNIVIQIQVKSGGIPWRPTKLFNTGGHIIIGVATQQHLNKDQRLYWFFADYGNGNYPLFLSEHFVASSDQESIKLSNFVKESIDQFKQRHGNIPSLIIIYHSGAIGEDKDLQRLKNEFKPFIEKLKSFRQKTTKLVIIYAIRDGKMRFSLKKGSGRDQVLVNPPAMTIVDKIGLTSRTPQFYCVHQSVSQKATASPTLYNILINELASEQSINLIEEITAVYSCLYFNWQGSIPLPAPLMYATKGLTWLTTLYPNSQPPLLAHSLRTTPVML